MKSICVFCGSSDGRGQEYTEQAAALGGMLARRGITLVYGGASVGIMGVVADAALAEGGTVLGVIPEQLVRAEVAHQGLTELYVVADMHERKAKMSALSEGFLALPGGAGTLEELFEVWTWAQLGLHDKPIGLVDTGGYYRKLVEFIDHMLTEGFLRPSTRELLAVDPDPAVLLEKFAGFAGG
ncbi:LOG family protein [Amycolatopsis aidingensis]|uniref:LOG family protein n=1 Tax=Amycolatopsis aidingensis TaxID=2842453 RepID=UPI001C0E614B|nr:TIGR00730 family Rossman fold protein [Amycolatopsis aidingensis]